jgi:hypothetical protein
MIELPTNEPCLFGAFYIFELYINPLGDFIE